MTKMHGPKRSFFTLLFLLISSTALAATIEMVVATVDNVPITMFELDQAMMNYGPKIQSETKTTGTALRAKVLDKLIDNKVFDNELKKSKIKIEQNEVDAYVDRILRSSRITLDTFEKMLTEKGMTLEKYKQDVHDQMVKNKFFSDYVGRKISITEPELREYFEKHLDEFKSSTSLKVAQMTLPFTESMTDADFNKMGELTVEIEKDLQTTPSFAMIANKYNGKPYTVQSGETGIIQLKDLNPQIAEAVKLLDIGKVSAPILTNSGIVIVKVLDRAKSSINDFSNVRDQVSDVLFNLKMEDALKGYTKELRKKAKIEIKGLGL